MLALQAISEVATSALVGTFAANGDIVAELNINDLASLRIYAATREFITYATDTPANQPFIGTLEKPITFERSIINTSGFGEINIGYGELELINTEADYDGLIDHHGVDGQRVRLRIGLEDNLHIVDSYNNFTIVADLTATGWTITEDRMTISLRDNSFLLEVPAQPNSYAGTGDLEGGEDLAGKRKPLVCGQVRNISPPLLIPAELVYQVHDGSVEAIDAVYDAAGLLENHGDHPDSDTMRATIIMDGYVTCLAEGLFMLGASPFGKITADVRGENTDGYIETTADIVSFLILNASDLTIDDFDLQSFEVANEIQPAPIGYFLNTDSNATVAEVVGRLMGAISGWIGFDSIGKLQIGLVNVPSTVVVARYDQHDIITLTRDRLPSGVDPIIQRARVAYDVNWTVQQGTELIGEVFETQPELVSYLASPFRIAEPSEDQSGSILGFHPLAIDPDPVEAYFVNFSDAQAEADQRMALYGTERSMYRFTLKEHLFDQDIGDSILLTVPRLGLTNGKYLLVVQTREDLEQTETEVVGFG